MSSNAVRLFLFYLNLPYVCLSSGTIRIGEGLMSFNFRNYSILVADDSRLVTGTITAILKKFGCEQVHTAYKPLEVIQKCRQNCFDLIICDYNFQQQLNGFQLLEELDHLNLLPAKTVFMFLTGENDLKVVRSIIDADPDDYLLKPFKNLFFVDRLSSALKRKEALLPIYEQLNEHDYYGVIEACKQCAEEHPSYSKLIRKFKADALVRCKEYSSARTEYEEMLKEDDFDWIKTALANTFIETDDVTKAKDILDTVKSKDDNPYYHDEMSSIAVINNDLPQAISHLKQSAMLLDAGAERELVVANLSIANGSFDDAVTYMTRYYEKNKGTFRSGVYTQLNMIRCYLYKSRHIQNKSLFERVVHKLNPLIDEVRKRASLEHAHKLIMSHIAFIRGDLKTAISEIKPVLQGIKTMHFYDLYHLCYLLEQYSFLNEVKQILPQCRVSIDDSQHPSILRSQTHMLLRFESRLQETQSEINSIRQQLTGSVTITEPSTIIKYIDLYFRLHELSPNSKKLCVAIVKFIAYYPVSYEGQYKIYDKLKECHEVIVKLSTEKELAELNYLTQYETAKKNIYLVLDKLA